MFESTCLLIVVWGSLGRDQQSPKPYRKRQCCCVGSFGGICWAGVKTAPIHFGLCPVLRVGDGGLCWQVPTITKLFGRGPCVWVMLVGYVVMCQQLTKPFGGGPVWVVWVVCCLVWCVVCGVCCVVCVVWCVVCGYGTNEPIHTHTTYKYTYKQQTHTNGICKRVWCVLFATLTNCLVLYGPDTKHCLVMYGPHVQQKCLVVFGPRSTNGLVIWWPMSNIVWYLFATPKHVGALLCPLNKWFVCCWAHCNNALLLLPPFSYNVVCVLWPRPK